MKHWGASEDRGHCLPSCVLFTPTLSSLFFVQHLQVINLSRHLLTALRGFAVITTACQWPVSEDSNFNFSFRSYFKFVLKQKKNTLKPLFFGSAVSEYLHWNSWWKRHSRLVAGRQKLPTVLMNGHSRHFLQRSFWNRFLCFCLLIDNWYDES